LHITVRNWYLLADADILLNELAHYSQELVSKPKCFILSKSDLLPSDSHLKLPQDWLTMSAATGEGIDTVLKRLYSMVVSVKEENE